MRQIEQITHTADKGIHIVADRLDELFRGALEGMAELQAAENDASGTVCDETIDIESPDRTALLIDFLSEVLTLSHIHRAIFTGLSLDHLSDSRLAGSVRGMETDRFGEDIKAVTHSQADIRKRPDGLLETVVVFDI